MCVLLALSAFFSGSETALFSLTRKQVRAFRDGNSLIGNIIYSVVGSPRSLLVTVLLGNMIVNVMFCSTAFALARGMNDPSRVIAANLAALLALIIFGEIAPKTVAVRAPAAFSKCSAIPMFLLQKAVSPAAMLFHLVRRERPRAHGDPSAMTPQEIKQIIASAGRGGAVGKRLSRLISEIVDFREIRVREVMVPRVDVVAFRKTDGMDDLIALIKKEKVKNIPVFSGYKDDVVGLISAKDVFCTKAGNPAELIRPVLIVPENKSIESLLIEFQRERRKFAVVVNEHGAMEGIVTIEDILEEIVGEIEDEFDRRRHGIRPESRYRMEIPGDLSLRDFNERFGCALEAKDVDTVGGYIAARLGRVPRVGDRVECESVRLLVKGVGRHRVTRVSVDRHPD